jgi:hypothetical protein
MAGYQTGWHRYYYIGRRFAKEMTHGDPALIYYKKATSLFGTITGDCGANRINPSGVDFPRVFMNEDGSMNSTMDEMVDDLLVLLMWINEKTDTDEFTPYAIESKFRETVNKWSGYYSDIGEFRLMIVVQICVLAGIVVKPSKDLNNLVYPVSDLGAAEQLKHIHDGSRDEVLLRILQEHDLEDFGTNCAESLLCETAANRVGTIKDYFFRGQFLFWLGKRGEQLVKIYGENEWCPVSR